MNFEQRERYTVFSYPKCSKFKTMITNQTATPVANFTSLFIGKFENRRRIGFCPEPEEVETSKSTSSQNFSASGIQISSEYLNVILSSFQEWFQTENNGGVFNNNHDTKFLNKINAARLLYKKGGSK